MAQCRSRSDRGSLGAHFFKRQKLMLLPEAVRNFLSLELTNYSVDPKIWVPQSEEAYKRG